LRAVTKELVHRDALLMGVGGAHQLVAGRLLAHAVAVNRHVGRLRGGSDNGVVDCFEVRFVWHKSLAKRNEGTRVDRGPQWPATDWAVCWRVATPTYSP
jgi:hypothetical protein